MTMRILCRRRFAVIAGGLLLAGCAAGAKDGGASGSAAARRDRADAVLRELEVKDKEILNVVRDEGRFLHQLVRIAGARRVLEIGSSNGYASIWIALALEETGGSLTAIDIDPERVRMAKANLRRCGLDGRVTCILADAHEIAPTLEGPFDFIYLDADKNGQLDYFNVLFPKLVPGGVLICHNAVELADQMEDYLEAVRSHPELETQIVRVIPKDGFAVSVRVEK
jgi:predicted O-methyltransferase YrrM